MNSLEKLSLQKEEKRSLKEVPEDADPFPPSKPYNSIGQSSASDILHDGFANIRMKHTGVMIGRETSNPCQCFRCQVFFQMIFNVINTRRRSS